MRSGSKKRRMRNLTVLPISPKWKTRIKPITLWKKGLAPLIRKDSIREIILL